MTMTPVRSLPMLAAGLLLAGAAQAHHPMDGAMPATAMEGLLSGLAHPVIGLDHLLFLLAAATLAGVSRGSPARSMGLLLLFAAGSLVGTVLRVPGVVLPLLEPLIGISLLAVAACLWRRWLPSLPPVLMLSAAAAGLLHGQAFGEAVIGAETTPVIWYLVGLLAVQCGLMLGLFTLVRRAARLGLPLLQPGVKLLGAAVAAVGVGSIGMALMA
jgi:urease accessory protein